MIQITGIPTFDKDGVPPKGWLKVFVDFIKQLRIQSKEVVATDDRGTLLNLWGSQRMFLSEVSTGMDNEIRTFYSLKSRQLGVTTVSLAIDLFWLATHDHMMGCLVADNEGNRNAFHQTLKNYYDSLPPSFVGKRFRKVKDNEDFMLFANGSRLDFLVAGARKKTWGESRGYTLAHLSEVSKYGNAEGLSSFRETLAETHPDRLFLYESTAFGRNHWYQMYLEGERDKLTKKSFFIGWWSKELNAIERKDARFDMYGRLAPNNDERELMTLVEQTHGVRISPEQLAWRRWRDADTSASKQDMDQNQPWLASQAFVQTGFSFFPYRYVVKLLDVIYDASNPIEFLGYEFDLPEHKFSMARMLPISDGNIERVTLRVWEQPHEEATYVIGCDPAHGRTDWKDRHAISVWRCYADKLVQVAEWADNNVITHHCAWVLAYLAGCYKNCIVNIELTGPGRQVFTELDRIREETRADYNRTWVEDREWGDFLSNMRWYMWHRPDSMGAGYAYHTEMTFRVKFPVLNALRDSLMSGALAPRSAPMLEEMTNVVQEGSEIGAPNMDKDDRVFAAVLAHMAWMDWVRPGMVARGATYEEVSKIESGTTNTTPAAGLVRNIVHNFWKSRADLANQEPPQTPLQTFMDERGLM